MNECNIKGDALIVLGMHRSGTSAMTGVLNCLGVQLGPKLYAPHKGINDKGYFEHSDIADLNDEALIALRSSWDDVLPLKQETWDKAKLDQYTARLKKLICCDFANASVWAVKDPRVCRLLPWWRNVLSDLRVRQHFLFVLRHPLEVTASLGRRDGFSKEKSLVLWIDHNLSAELHTRGERRAVINFNQLLSTPNEQIKRIQTSLQIVFPATNDQTSKCIEDFLSGGLRHHKSKSLPPESPLERIAYDIYSVFAEAADSAFTEDHETKLDILRKEFEGFRAAFPALLVEHLNTVNERRTEYNLTWLKVSRSWTWPLGKPIRYLERILGRDV